MGLPPRIDYFIPDPMFVLSLNLTLDNAPAESISAPTGNVPQPLLKKDWLSLIDEGYREAFLFLLDEMDQARY
jgi:hypothetical protein